MNLDTLKARVHPDFNNELGSFQRLLWYVVVFIPFLIFLFCAGFALLKYFIQPNKESISISNAGFAILAGLSSICFSYYKVIQTAGYNKLHTDVQVCGELFLTSAVAFIVASALKYSWLVTHEKTITTFSFLEGILNLAFKATFVTAELVCLYGLSKLVDVLHIRMTSTSR